MFSYILTFSMTFLKQMISVNSGRLFRVIVPLYSGVKRPRLLNGRGHLRAVPTSYFVLFIPGRVLVKKLHELFSDYRIFKHLRVIRDLQIEVRVRD